MQENEQPPRVGKAACRAFEEDFLSKIKAVRTYVCDGYVISRNKAYVVYRIDADHAVRACALLFEEEILARRSRTGLQKPLTPRPDKTPARQRWR
jgi:hypothetical protein